MRKQGPMNCARRATSRKRRSGSEGGVYRVAAHTAAGALAGGVPGALGAGTSAAAVPIMAKAIDQMGLPEPVRQALIATAGTLTGAVVGGASGAAAALNQTTNNYLEHEQIERFKAQLRAPGRAAMRARDDRLLEGRRTRAKRGCQYLRHEAAAR